MPNLEDGKWHHLAFCRRYTGSQGYYDIYVDGKLEVVHTVGGTGATWSATDSDFVVGAYAANGSSGLERCHIENIRIWGTTRTAPQIRADMFNSTPTSSASDCIANFTFNEGTSTIITASDPNSMSSNETAGAWDGDWAGAGTFTEGTSTLVFTGSGKTWTMGSYLGGGTQYYNMTINAPFIFKSIDNTYGAAYMVGAGTFTLGASGTLTSTALETLYFGTNASTINVSANTDGLAALHGIILRTGGSNNVNIPELTTKRIFLETGNGTATGDLTITVELEVASGTTFNANGNTINTAEVDVNGGTLNLTNSTLNFATASQEWNMLAGSTLTTGNTTVTGYSSGNPTQTVLPYTSASSSNFEIVGDVSNLKATLATDLTVIGSVTNCITVGTDAIIRQWHHTLDTQQLLDADSGGDDDLRLTKPALDNSHELQTG